MINSRKLEDLTPDTKAKAIAFMAGCEEIGIEILITSTYRDMESQHALYAQGRTSIGRVVTNATAGHSFHNWRVAFDVVPIVNGKAVWDDDRLWHRIGAIAKSLEIEWGGDWKFADKPHFQVTHGKTIAQFTQGSDVCA